MANKNEKKKLTDYKRRQYNEQLLKNDALNTAVDRGLDEAYNDEIIAQMKAQGVPIGVINKIASHAPTTDKNLDIVNVYGDVIKNVIRVGNEIASRESAIEADIQKE